MALPIVCQAKRSRAIATALLLVAAACARTGLLPGELGEDDPSGAGSTASNGSAPAEGSSSSGGSSQNAAGAPLGGVAGQAMMPASGAPALGTPHEPNGGRPTTPSGDPNECVPSPEACNGRDDDCNGAVDDMPGQACEGGGFRFCVAGRMSECPKRCDVCVPGSVRVCQNSYCLFWGEQECAADGQGFGICREAQPPPECAAIAKKKQDSPELEQCCIDNGYCCVDDHDLDGDGNRREMLGACQDIACQ